MRYFSRLCDCPYVAILYLGYFGVLNLKSWKHYSDSHSASRDLSTMEDISRLIERAKRTGKLDLKNRGLSEIPESVFTLTDLRVLRLSKNQIQSISPVITKLLNLQWLFLDSNPLQTL